MAGPPDVQHLVQRMVQRVVLNGVERRRHVQQGVQHVVLLLAGHLVCVDPRLQAMRWTRVRTTGWTRSPAYKSCARAMGGNRSHKVLDKVLATYLDTQDLGGG